jgi:hypothetical protein
LFSFLTILRISEYFSLVPPADVSTLSLPSLERRDHYHSRHHHHKKSTNSDENSSQITFEDIPSFPAQITHTVEAPTNACGALKGSSTEKMTSTEHHQEYITIRNEHMKNNSDKNVSSPHIDKKARKS